MAEITQENPLGLKSLAESQEKGVLEIYGENLKKAFTYDWIFSTPLEKTIITTCFIYSVWNLGSFLWELFG